MLVHGVAFPVRLVDEYCPRLQCDWQWRHSCSSSAIHGWSSVRRPLSLGLVKCAFQNVQLPGSKEAAQRRMVQRFACDVELEISVDVRLLLETIANVAS